MNLLYKLFLSFINLFKSILRINFKKFYPFIQGHNYLSDNQVVNLKNYIDVTDENIISNYEKKYSKIIGLGHSVSFASGRMAFYVLMNYLKIGTGDEVILTGFTCSVMANAVLRLGAKPVYSDIDPNTFGSSYLDINEKITEKTKLIVCQHTFGIPCNILPIVKLAKENNIFLVEDCALSLGSKINNIIIGNFGDAAIFSTDHSKPINTIIGGMLYSNNTELINHIKKSQSIIPDLPKNKKHSIFKRLMIERKYCNSKNYGKLDFIDTLSDLKNLFKNNFDPFLSNDYGSEINNGDYNYPSKLPTFLAVLGLYELEIWEDRVKERKSNLNKIIGFFKSQNKSYLIPKCYLDKNLDIIPLRYIWYDENNNNLNNFFKKIIKSNWVWFKNPIIGTTDIKLKYYYKPNDCIIAEKIGTGIFNLPCNFTISDTNNLLTYLTKVYK